MTTVLAGRTALIVGANGGIGRAIAHALGAAGARLVLAARDGTRLAQLRAELGAVGVTSRIVPTDATDDAPPPRALPPLREWPPMSPPNTASSA